MAKRKTQTFLPQVFQTDTNQKFLSATMDQLVSEPDLQTLYGYVGHKFAPTFKSGDSYVIENSTDRQNYQLEPSVVVDNPLTGENQFFAGYIDLLNQIKYQGGLTDNQTRLFSGESYSYDGLFDFDKFVNFNQYFWLAEGPDPVEVTTNIVYQIGRAHV